METTHPSIHLGMNHYDGGNDVIDALVLSAFVDGRLPWLRGAHLDRVRADATLLPDGVAASRVSVSSSRRAYLAEGDGWMVHVTRWDDASADIQVLARDEPTGVKVFDDITTGAIEDAKDDGDTVVAVGFWHGTGHGPRRRVTKISVDPWPSIRRNYPRRVAKSLDQLMAIDPERLSGRILLLHGPPGTGKTTALRALALAWKEWCRLDYVVDPERLLGDSGYLLSVVLERDHDDDDERWRLLLLEDCDELIGARAKSGVGQSLARLLNVSDGLLGQGLDVIVAITTNEPLTKLHPAIIRPGRCIAHIELGRFSRLEAIDWLGRPASIGSDGITLAELFALRGELSTVESTAPAEPVGMYL